MHISVYNIKHKHLQVCIEIYAFTRLLYGLYTSSYEYNSGNVEKLHAIGLTPFQITVFIWGMNEKVAFGVNGCHVRDWGFFCVVLFGKFFFLVCIGYTHI